MFNIDSNSDEKHICYRRLQEQYSLHDEVNERLSVVRVGEVDELENLLTATDYTLDDKDETKT